MVAKKVRSIWDEFSDGARLWAKRCGAIGATLVAISGVVAMGPEVYAPDQEGARQEIARALAEDRAAAQVDRANLARQTARIDTVMAEQAAARLRDEQQAALDREQTRILIYLKCLTDKSKDECQSEYMERQMGGTP